MANGDAPRGAYVYMLQEAPPPPVLESLRDYGLNGAPALFTTSADLSFDGQFQRHWLIVTPEHISVVEAGDRPRVRLRLGIEQVESFRTSAGVGSGCLQARVDGAWIDVARYSNSLANRFAKVARKLEQLRSDGRLLVGPGDEVDERRCPRCGLALSFAGDVCPRCINRGAVLSRVWALLRPHRGAALIMCLLIVLGVAAELAPPKLQQYLVDHVLRVDAAGTRPEALLGALLGLVGALACTRLLLAVVNAFKGMLANRVGTTMTSDLRARLVDKLQQLSVDYYDRQPVGVLMSRVAHDTEALYGFIHQVTSGFLLQVLQLAAVGIMLFTLNAKLALWTMIPMPFVLYGSWFFWRYVYPKYYRYWDAASKQAGALAGMLAGIRVVKAFAQEQREFDRFQATSDALRQSRLGVEASASTFSAVMQLLFSLGGLIVWFVGGRDVLGSRMTLGALMAFLAYLAMFYAPLANLAQLTTWLTSFLTASQRVFELLDTPNRVSEPERPSPVPGLRGRICFDNVTFGYDRHHPVLTDFNLEIRPGEMVGIVGRSGSGKTTLVNLIARFYDPDAGRVTIDGRDVRQLARDDLRRHIGLVLQEPFLFRGTVWENLVYGQPQATPEEAFRAAKAANAHDFIMRLPFAYDTPLGERGAGLSGGEKQRLSIARALLYNPRVLILDEATSSVDTEAEKAIQDALAVLTRGRTTIAIAHRLSTLQNADRIVVLDHGKLIEEGTHEELLARDGVYARLVRIQTQVKAEPAVDELMLVDGVRSRAIHGPQNGDGSPRYKAAASGPVPGARAANRIAARWHESNGVTDVEAAPETDLLQTLAEEERFFAPRWLLPHTARLQLGEHGALQMAPLPVPSANFGEGEGGGVYSGVFAVCALPATCPGKFISLRYADAEGQEHEIGLVRDLAEWPPGVHGLLRQALSRRYFIRQIRAIDSIVLKYGLLAFQVQTDHGPAQFTMRNSHSQAQDYGRAGKLLIDVDDNRYLVADVDALPRRQQLLFRRYVYW